MRKHLLQKQFEHISIILIQNRIENPLLLYVLNNFPNIIYQSKIVVQKQQLCGNSSGPPRCQVRVWPTIFFLFIFYMLMHRYVWWKHTHLAKVFISGHIKDHISTSKKVNMLCQYQNTQAFICFHRFHLPPLATTANSNTNTNQFYASEREKANNFQYSNHPPTDSVPLSFVSHSFYIRVDIGPSQPAKIRFPEKSRCLAPLGLCGFSLIFQGQAKHLTVSRRKGISCSHSKSAMY